MSEHLSLKMDSEIFGEAKKKVMDIIVVEINVWLVHVVIPLPRRGLFPSKGNFVAALSVLYDKRGLGSLPGRGLI